ncbi:MAG: alpha/beta fold hydrolase [Bacteroidota bacterium]
MRLAGLFIVLVTTCFGQPKDFAGIQKINGANLFLRIKGHGDHVLVLHGGPGLNHSYFRPYLDDLEKDFTVVYFDQRASGQSAIPSVDSISMKFFTDDIEAIRKILKADKLNILAHSWGAVLAVRYGMVYPENVSKMILSNPAMLSREYDHEAAQLIKQKTSKEDSVERAQLTAAGALDVKKYERLFQIGFKASAYNNENVTRINLNLPPNFSEANQTLFTALMKDPALGADLYDELKAFNFPVLVIHGEADVIPPKSIVRLKESLPQVQLATFTQSGHFPFVEEKHRYVMVVSRFLRQPKTKAQH